MLFIEKIDKIFGSGGPSCGSAGEQSGDLDQEQHEGTNLSQRPGASKWKSIKMLIKPALNLV